jgi:hypothetical protein
MTAAKPPTSAAPIPPSTNGSSFALRRLEKYGVTYGIAGSAARAPLKTLLMFFEEIMCARGCIARTVSSFAR